MTYFLHKGHAADLNSLKVNKVFQTVLQAEITKLGDDKGLTKAEMITGCAKRQALLLQWEGH